MHDNHGANGGGQIVPGGSDEWFPRTWEPFVVGAAHTLYEWSLLFDDRHPGELHDSHRGNTREDRRAREDFLGGGNEKASISRAVYDELAAKVRDTHRKVKVGEIQQPPLWQFVYRADEPAELDLTLCVIDAGPVLELARRRGDGGRYIRELLARHRPPSREKSFLPDALRTARDWLIENGCPAPRDGNQAKLEQHVTAWLEDHGYDVSVSTVRRWVTRSIRERHAELAKL
jgi:hypothetical protein